MPHPQNLWVKKTNHQLAITIKNLLRKLCPIKGFLFRTVEMTESSKKLIKVTIEPRKKKPRQILLLRQTPAHQRLPHLPRPMVTTPELEDCAKMVHSKWDSVFSRVKWVVAHGLAHRKPEDITAIGVDEVAYCSDNTNASGGYGER